MKNIRVNKLKLNNFKGIKDLDLDLEGSNISIYGDNGIGKTTVFDSFMWLLFDKDSLNSSNFNIKTLDKDNKPIHKLDHKVFGELDINGEIITLEKIYKEKWTRKRGETEETLTGHTTDYFINDIPKKKKEYEEYLSNLIDEDTFRILTNPLFFNTDLHWKDRRNIALELCDEVSDNEILKSNKKLEILNEYLKDMSINDLKTSMNSKRKELSEEIKDIPGRIDELSSQLNSEVDISILKKEKDSLERELDTFKNNQKDVLETRVNSIKGSIRILENEIKEILQDSKRNIKIEIDELIDKKREKQTSLSEIESNKINYEREIRELNQQNKELKTRRKELAEAWKNNVDRNLEDDFGICPTCRQDLPKEKVDKIINDFNIEKRNSINTITEQGKKVAEQIDLIGKKIDSKIFKLSDLTEKENECLLELKSIENDYVDKSKELESIDISSNTEYKEKKFKLEELEKEIKDIEKEIEMCNNNEDKIEVLKSKISDLNIQLAKKAIEEENKKRIEDLANRERLIAQEIAKTEQIDYLIDKFLMLKSEKIEENLNSKFKLVKFKLFDEILSGGIKETFVTTVEGVPFEDLNNAMKINAGLDIIETLSSHYNVRAPIFLDNRESVNEIPDIEGQVINLIVSKHKTLNVRKEH